MIKGRIKEERMSKAEIHDRVAVQVRDLVKTYRKPGAA